MSENNMRVTDKPLIITNEESEIALPPPSKRPSPPHSPYASAASVAVESCGGAGGASGGNSSGSVSGGSLSEIMANLRADGCTSLKFGVGGGGDSATLAAAFKDEMIGIIIPHYDFLKVIAQIRSMYTKAGKAPPSDQAIKEAYSSFLKKIDDDVEVVDGSDVVVREQLNSIFGDLFPGVDILKEPKARYMTLVEELNAFLAFRTKMFRIYSTNTIDLEKEDDIVRAYKSIEKIIKAAAENGMTIDMFDTGGDVLWTAKQFKDARDAIETFLSLVAMKKHGCFGSLTIFGACTDAHRPLSEFLNCLSQAGYRKSDSTDFCKRVMAEKETVGALFGPSRATGNTVAALSLATEPLNEGETYEERLANFLTKSIGSRPECVKDATILPAMIDDVKKFLDAAERSSKNESTSDDLDLLYVLPLFDGIYADNREDCARLVLYAFSATYTIMLDRTSQIEKMMFYYLYTKSPESFDFYNKLEKLAERLAEM